MTIKQAKAELRKHGMTVVKNGYQEYRVNFKGEGESGAYYTDDLDDAVQTGKIMAQEQHRPNYDCTYWQVPA